MQKTTLPPDIEIAQSVEPKHINEIGKMLSIDPDRLEHFGPHKAKIPLDYIDENHIQKSKLILVTAITPTPAGEGKTTVSVGLNDGLRKLRKDSVVVLREPSLGPVFGIKGGAAGGGHAQLIPMVDINLHFTGDFAAIEKANNLLAALIDNNIQSRQHNLGIDPRTVSWRWVMDMNDRSLRHVITGLGGKSGGLLRESGFDITAASEIMAILCLAENLQDLKERMGRIYIGDKFTGEPVFAKDLKAPGSMAVLLKDAIKPNLVQSLEGNPAIIHGGPFANIAQGTNSLIGTKTAMSLGDYVVTEAGFGADLGAEKFFNIKCENGRISPSAVVLVATVRALKYHGGKAREELNNEDLEALTKGLPNLVRHIENLQSFGVPVVVAVNKFIHDTDAEVQTIIDQCETLKVPVSVAEGWEKGGDGSIELAEKVVKEADRFEGAYEPLYDWGDSIEEKILKVSKTIYKAKNVEYSQEAFDKIKKIQKLEMDKMPVCIAKTQASFSDDAKKLGSPQGFTLHVRNIEIASGAGFLIPLTGKMLRMPGLPAVPAAEGIDIDEKGEVTGLS